MNFQDCFTGQRVAVKENGKIASIRKVHGNGELELDYENGSTGKVHARAVEPAGAAAAAEQSDSSGPMRACPQCAAKMPTSETKCPKCGFEYGVKKSKGGGFGKVVVILIALAAIAYAVWKFVLHEKLPW